MLRGFYTAASGMIAQQRYQEALGNNVANVNTPGYKADQAVIRSFPEMLLTAQGTKQLPTATRNLNLPFYQTIGPINTGAYVQEYVPNFAQGDLRETGLPTDIALEQIQVPDETGALFYRVQNAEGEERFTRNGSFTIDGDGFLVTSEGFYVLSDAGTPIQPGSANFTVTTEGVIQSDNGAIPLGMTYVADANSLTKEGDNVYSGEGEDAPAGAVFRFHQNYVEHSNVDAAQTMTEMMTAYRNFELNQRVLRAYDESMGKAVSEIGRLG